MRYIVIKPLKLLVAYVINDLGIPHEGWLPIELEEFLVRERYCRAHNFTGQTMAEIMPEMSFYWDNEWAIVRVEKQLWYIRKGAAGNWMDITEYECVEGGEVAFDKNREKVLYLTFIDDGQRFLTINLRKVKRSSMVFDEWMFPIRMRFWIRPIWENW